MKYDAADKCSVVVFCCYIFLKENSEVLAIWVKFSVAIVIKQWHVIQLYKSCLIWNLFRDTNIYLEVCLKSMFLFKKKSYIFDMS